MLLHCHSYYSLRHGVLSEEDWIDFAVQDGRDYACLTDINSTTACLQFIKLCQQKNIKPIIGADIRNNHQFLYLLIAKNNQGYLRINQFISEHLHQDINFPLRPPQSEDYVIIYSLSTAPDTLRDGEYIGIEPRELVSFGLRQNHLAQDRYIIKPTATFRYKRDHNLHRILRAIDCNTLLSTLDPGQVAPASDILYSSDEILSMTTDHPQLIDNLQHIISQCRIEFTFGTANRTSQNLATYTDSKQNDYNLLKQLCEDNLPKRYPIVTDTIRERIDMELKLIQEMDFVAFFLINWDIVHYAISQGYYHVGRGSGANSIVAYLLHITNVDPIDLDLYFERFLNMFRSSPPDFDIDFSWRDREDVTRYIFQRFGDSGRCALLGTYSTFQYRAAIREVGKVFGLTSEDIDNLSKHTIDIGNLDDISRLTLQYATLLMDKPNLISVHSAGIIITERPIHQFVSTYLPPKGFPTTHFDMMIAEDVGIYKFDILGQRGLAKIKEAIELVSSNQGIDLIDTIHDIPKLKEDTKIKHILSHAECIGCFYVESPAMRMLLRKLEVDTYLELVAASSIIRPGVAKSGMMREYILRTKNPERRLEAIPELLELMPDTYGIMVYQEDVLKVAHAYGGLSLGEADILRRAMSGKFRNKESFNQLKEKFFQHCKEQNRDLDTTTNVWMQIESFAGYAFAKGHSASFAVESYQAMYLKAYYPIEYMVATLNNGGGFYSREFYLLEARKNGAHIELPCINRSDYLNVIDQSTIYLGFMNLENLQTQTIKAIISTRRQEGAFLSIDDFINRVDITQEQLDILIRIQAFRLIESDHKKLMWTTRFIKEKQKTQYHNQLFATNSRQFTLPHLETNLIEKILEEIELLGFSIESPFALIDLQQYPSLRAAQLHECLHQQVSMIGYLVTYKTTYTSIGDKMWFGTFIDPQLHYIDTVHFPPSARSYPFQGSGHYLITGRVVEEFGFYSIEVNRMEKLSWH